MTTPSLEAGRALVGTNRLSFWSTTNGKKAGMAVSGIILSGFVLLHLAGNLQIFLGPEIFDGYSRALHEMPELLWPVRVLLLLMILLHVWSAIELAVIKRDARRKGYERYSPRASSYASRTMYMSGPILAAFIIYHLMQFSWGTGGTSFDPADPYGNVIEGFRNPWIAGFYILAMGLLCLHLRHGLWSMFQSLGLHSPRRFAFLRTAAGIVAGIVFIGFISIPIAVLTGLLASETV